MKQLASSRPRHYYVPGLIVSIFLGCGLLAYLFMFKDDSTADMLARTILLLDHKCQQISTDTEKSNFINKKNDDFPRVMHRLFGFWDSKLPKAWKDNLKSCHEKENDFKLMTWNRTTSTKLIAKHYPWFLNRFQSYKYDVQRADAARYFILFHYGGMYLDMDIKCVNKSSLTLFYKHLIDKSKIFVDSMLLPTDPYGVTNFFMVSQKCSHMMRLMSAMLENFDRWYGIPYFTVLFSTGPLFVTSAHEKFEVEEPDLKESVIMLQQNQFWNTYFVDNGKLHGTWHTWDAAPVLLMYDHFYIFIAIVLSIVILGLFILVKLWYYLMQASTVGSGSTSPKRHTRKHYTSL